MQYESELPSVNLKMLYDHKQVQNANKHQSRKESILIYRFFKLICVANFLDLTDRGYT
jgi:hypothetical protein